MILLLTVPNEGVKIDEQEMPVLINYINNTSCVAISCFLTLTKLLLFNQKFSLIVSICLFVFQNLKFIQKLNITLFKWNFIIFGLLGSISWIKIISDLILDCTIYISIEYKISPTLLASLLIAAGNTIPDFFNDGNLARIG